MQNTQLSNIQVVLCNTSHPGNIGSAARAMKTMGITNLTLVAPLVQPDDHSLALSCNAKDVINDCTIVSSLQEAIAKSHLVIAMTGRKREFNDRIQSPKQIVPEILEAISNQEQVSLVFGNEQNGLTIEQLERCNRLVTIPGNPEYFSLNLAQAVQILCYEIYSNFNPDLEHLKTEMRRATAKDVEHLLKRLDVLLDSSKFYTARNQTWVLRRLQNVLHKAELNREEADLLHGIFNNLCEKIQGKS